MRLLRDPLALSLGLLALLSLGTPLVVLSGYDLAAQFEDDAFYYFQIAKNVAHGYGFTFDGLHPTNGFHPLWLLLLLPIFRGVPGLDGPVRAAGLLEAVLLGAASMLVYAAMPRRSQALLAGMLVFACPGTRGVLRIGLESALLVALLAAIWCAQLRAEPRTDRRFWLLGGLCALASLARLEAVCSVFVLAWLERAQLRERPRAWLALLAPSALAIAGYVAWNRLEFGVWLPVSGMVKHHWATQVVPASVRALLPLTAAAAVGGALIFVGRRGWLERLQPFALPVVTSVLMLSIDLAALGHLERWYWAPAVLSAAILCAALLPAPAMLRTLALACAVASALLRIPNAITSVRSYTYQAHVRGEAADWLHRHLAPSARVGAWNGGMLGYYSGLPVVILDGLANSPEFYRRAILASDLSGYLRDERIAYLVTLSCRIDPVLWTSLEPVGHVERDYALQGPLSERPGVSACEGGQNGVFGLWKRRQ